MCVCVCVRAYHLCVGGSLSLALALSLHVCARARAHTIKDASMDFIERVPLPWPHGDPGLAVDLDGLVADQAACLNGALERRGP